MGLPLRLGLETLGWGAPHLPWGASLPPWPPPPPSRWILAGAPLPGAYIKGGREGSNTTALGASLLPCNTSLSLAEASEAVPETHYIHHHAVVLLDLHQPLLPPC